MSQFLFLSYKQKSFFSVFFFFLREEDFVPESVSDLVWFLSAQYVGSIFSKVLFGSHSVCRCL